MELAIVCVILLVCYFVFRITANIFALLSGGRFRAYRLLAERYHGRYESRGMYDPPTVSFTHHHALVRVGLAPLIPGQPANPRTRVVVRFERGIPFRLELAPRARPNPRQDARGTRPVALGIPLLDRDFAIRTNDPEMARDFLVPAVVSAVVDLQSMAHAGGILVSISPERLLVQVDRNLGLSVDSLDRAVRDTLILQDGLSRGVAQRMTTGIDIVGQTDQIADDPATEVICKVCGEPITDQPVVICTQCRTPHHRECWEYVGGCSIYGCASKQSIPG